VYRLAPIINVLAVVIGIFACTMLFPLAWSIGLDDGIAIKFVEAMGLSFAIAGVLWASTRRYRRELTPRDGFLLVAAVWTVLPAIGALPLLLAVKGLSFTDAYFECVSGLTTTGATIFVGLEKLPQSLNIWRTFMVWMGGMGVVVLAVAILPLLGVGGSQIYKAETPGPMKDAKLTPRIAETAKGLWLVYGLISVACLLSLKVGGLSWLDATVHTGSIMGLGGFSNYDNSFGQFNSALLDGIACVFMLLAGFNFALHFLALRERSPKPYLRDLEGRWYLAVLLGSCLMIALFLLLHGVYGDFFTALRYAAFNVISIATTTGLATTDYALWPAFAPVWMIFLSCFVTCAGSTGGGIKMIRFLILLKQAKRELVRIVHPKVVAPVKFGRQVIENNVIYAILAFMLMYGGTIVALSFLLLASGLDIVTAISAIVACVNNMGPGLGQVGPSTTYTSLTDFQTWVCTVAMLLGRLELFTLLVILTPTFWRR
jgi:trk system potassium uptake protein